MSSTLHVYKHRISNYILCTASPHPESIIIPPLNPHHRPAALPPNSYETLPKVPNTSTHVVNTTFCHYITPPYHAYLAPRTHILHTPTPNPPYPNPKSSKLLLDVLFILLERFLHWFMTSSTASLDVLCKPSPNHWHCPIFLCTSSLKPQYSKSI